MKESPSPQDQGFAEQSKIYVALIAFFVLALMGIGLGSLFGIALVFIYLGGIQAFVEALTNPTYAREYGHIWLPVALASLIGGFVLFAVYIWRLLFVRSGYLSVSSVRRITEGNFLTPRAERIRVMIGYVTYISIFFGLGLGIAFYGEKSPADLFTAIGLNALGIYTVIHAYRRYRKGSRDEGQQ